MKTDCNSGLRGNGSNLSDLDIQLEAFFKKPYFVLVRSTFLSIELYLAVFQILLQLESQKRISLGLFLLFISSET